MPTKSSPETPIVSPWCAVLRTLPCLLSLRTSLLQSTRTAAWQAHQRRPFAKRRLWVPFAALLWSLQSYQAPAQVVPAARQPPPISVFATGTMVTPNIGGYGNQLVFGGSTGAYLPTRYLIGLELRGSITRWGGREHQEAILFGPRAAFHLGPFSTYAEALAGPAHSWEPPPNRKYYVVDKVSADITFLGGIDLHLRNRISLRVGEVSYSRIYRNDPHSLDAIGISAGIVYRPHFAGRGER